LIHPAKSMISYRRRVILKISALCLAGGLFSKLTSSFAQSKTSNSRNALVIGNSTYAKNSLLNPINDARAMGAQLGLMGFQVNLLLDTNLSTLNDEISKFALLLERNKSIGLFYYAGHGVQLNWSNYLVPVDAQIGKTEDIQQKCYELNKMLSQLTKASNPMNIIILDACRDNPFGKSLSLSQKGLNQFDAPPGSILSYATAPGNVANDGIGTNGLFTENLLKEMRDPDAKIEDVFKRVRLNVRLGSKGTQIPWESTSLEQDFYFNSMRVDPLVIEQKVAQALNPAPVSVVNASTQESLKLSSPTAPSLLANVVIQEPVKSAPILISSSQPEVALNPVRESKNKTAEDKDKQFEEELKLWESAKNSNSKDLTIQYIKQYPSGSFSELAQTQLDVILRSEGEKKLKIETSTLNPFSQGSSSGILNYKIGDKFAYEVRDILTNVIISNNSEMVTAISRDQISFNNGVKIIDRMGNELVSNNPKFITPAQFYPNEYAIGKKWVTEFDRMRTPLSLGSARVNMSFLIDKREVIKQSYGSFDAFRVKGEGRNSYGGKILLTYWIDPDKCPAPIKTELWGYGNTGRLNTSEITNLISYIKSD